MVLLIAQPGRTYASLRVLLKSLYPLIQIEQAEQQTVMHLLAPDWSLLVLIDAALPNDEGRRVGAEIKQIWP